MSLPNMIMVITFLALILVGLALNVAYNASRQRPEARIRARLKIMHSSSGSSTSRQKILQDLTRAQAEARRRQRRQAMGTLGYYFNRLDTVGGKLGSRILVISAIAILLISLLLLSLGWVPTNWWSIPLALFVAPLATVVLLYRRLVERFQVKFLHQLPDALDTITRASQAGIPVTQSIRNIGAQFSAPLGPEFRRMGDSLLLGNDIQDVMDEAVLRIESPDFAFFAVCLSLQRDTGGSLVEALTNLAAIIRARRDLRLKTKAMTAEGRLSGLILAVMPLFIGGMLFMLSPDYIGSLFITPEGRRLLWIAGIMLALGIASIRKIAQMEV